jgi:glucokinase
MEGPFIQAFQDKGRFSALMRRIPVGVILNEKAPLSGAAQFAFLKQ